MFKPNAAASRRGRSDSLNKTGTSWPLGSAAGSARLSRVVPPFVYPFVHANGEQIQMKIAMQSCINPEIAMHVSRFPDGYMAHLYLHAVSVSGRRRDMRERQPKREWRPYRLRPARWSLQGPTGSRGVWLFACTMCRWGPFLTCNTAAAAAAAACASITSPITLIANAPFSR
jgi:hypothetical protein